MPGVPQPLRISTYISNNGFDSYISVASFGVSGIEGNLTSIGTPDCICLSENEKINATNNKDITAIPELTRPI